MANIHSAIKRIRSNERKRRYNQVHRSRARSLVKRTRRLIAGGQVSEAGTSVQEAVSALDKAAQKGAMPKNTAARRKSRLMRQLNAAREQGGR